MDFGREPGRRFRLARYYLEADASAVKSGPYDGYGGVIASHCSALDANTSFAPRSPAVIRNAGKRTKKSRPCEPAFSCREAELLLRGILGGGRGCSRCGGGVLGRVGCGSSSSVLGGVSSGSRSWRGCRCGSSGRSGCRSGSRFGLFLAAGGERQRGHRSNNEDAFHFSFSLTIERVNYARLRP